AVLPVHPLFLAMWTPPWRSPVARSAGRARKQLRHVAVVEARLDVGPDGPECFLELRQRVLASLGVRVVRREHEQFGPRLLDHPSDWLARVGRELEVAAHVLGGREREVAQRLLGPLERAPAVVELAQPGDDPPGALLDASAAQFREAIEQAVVDQHT